MVNIVMFSIVFAQNGRFALYTTKISVIQSGLVLVRN